jgi:hypothetical protein
VKRTLLWIAALVVFATLAIVVAQRPKPNPSGAPTASSTQLRTTPSASASAPARAPVIAADSRPLQPSAVHADAASRLPQPPSATPATGAQAQATTGARALEEIRALVDQGHIGAARVRAEHALREIPDGPEARQIMSLTGVHPHP